MEFTINLLIILLSFIPGYYLGSFILNDLIIIASFLDYVLILCCGIVYNIFWHNGQFIFVEPIANNTKAKNLGLFITTISFFYIFLAAFIVEIFYSFYTKIPLAK